MDVVDLGPSHDDVHRVSSRVVLDAISELDDGAGDPAPRLFLSVDTVKTRTQSIYSKVGLGSRGEVLALYRSDGAAA